jgi:hypothetical protein
MHIKVTVNLLCPAADNIYSPAKQQNNQSINIPTTFSYEAPIKIKIHVQSTKGKLKKTTLTTISKIFTAFPLNLPFKMGQQLAYATLYPRN